MVCPTASGGGWNLRAIAGLDRWLSKQNPAYRPVSPQKAPHRFQMKRCGIIIYYLQEYSQFFFYTAPVTKHRF